MPKLCRPTAQKCGFFTFLKNQALAALRHRKNELVIRKFENLNRTNIGCIINFIHLKWNFSF